jgi:hypothetical protein
MSTNHQVTCTDCEGVFECSCPNPETHTRRKERGWDDRCSPCEREAQAGWFKHLDTLPETRIYDPIKGPSDL